MRAETHDTLYSRTFFLGFLYNFIIALHFTNNALYPLFVLHEGGGAAMVGVFMGTYAVAGVLGRPLVAVLIDRLGPRWVLFIGSLCLSLPAVGFIGLLGHGVGVVALTLRAVQGFGYGAHFSATFALAAQITPVSRRTEAMAMYGVSGLAGAMVGPAAAEWLIHTRGLPAFFLAMTAVGLLAAGVVLLVRVRTPDGAARPPLELFRALRSSRMILPAALAFLLAVSYSSPTSFLATVAAQRGVLRFSLYFTSWGLAGMLIRFVGGRWGDRVGLRRVLVPAFALYAAGMLVIHTADSAMLFAAAGVLCGCAHGIGFPAVVSLGYTLAPRDVAGSAMALITGMMDAGAAVAALLVGPLAERFGYGVVFPVAACSSACAVLLLLLHIRREPRKILRADT
jgi:MFS family permease